MTDRLERELTRYVDKHRRRLLQILRDLVRIPSENTPPSGAEASCQTYAADLLRNAGWNVDLYELDTVPGLREHALYWNGRNYEGRPNLDARRQGTGGGRSLVLSGHMDTVPRGSQNWTRNPFSGESVDGRLYGRGANDMKAGNAMNLFVAQAIQELGVQLQGDLMIESVVDEEFGGVNGTLAGRLKGFNADAAVISEATFLRICPAQRGGRTVHLTVRTGNAGILTEGKYPDGIAGQLTYLLSRIPAFAELRRTSVATHPAFAATPDPVPVSVTKVSTGPWGTGEPITVPVEGRIELYWQLMPGEKPATVDRQFLAWLDGVVAASPKMFPSKPEVEFPIRFLPGSASPNSEALVRELSLAAAGAIGKEPAVAGIEGPCDLFVFHSFGIPAVLWGPSGGNTHAADEYVDIDSVVSAAKALLLFVCRWCGVQE